MKRRAAVLPATAATLAAASCAGRADTPLAYSLPDDGPVAQPVHALDSGLTALGVLVCIVIAALLAIALTHRRPASDADDGARTANAIVGIGTVISTVLLFGALVAMLRVLAAVAQPPQRAAFTLRVTSNDWWWKAA
ncbi:hypothetical protein [Paraburkholderia caballeronis]|uniref:hypothetical protein n=1 Tax=Paraburkholderia caballeronis TaxID=416943 RepID=UPI00106505DC|nr:hypothetical protein [Paraburkholderia caballeronis]TDV21075.1 hypothetical protein C7408_101594 [Paraburkholderia caballeronis]TDV21504.1 hypothetical protein C7406_102404 [Paraburkholderia caballeronis]TDV33543.1 hypothetical protein C7404_101690 [Paraburkholderia caballeronis]